jgi:hypothetical protein
MIYRIAVACDNKVLDSFALNKPKYALIELE